MRKIRKGKDIVVRWSLYRNENGERVPFAIDATAVLKVQTPYGTITATEVTIEGNVVSWTFRGKDQEHLGYYGLELVQNDGEKGMVTVDTCTAFALVAHSCEETPDVGGDVVTDAVMLEGEVAFAPLVIELGGESYDDTELRDAIADLQEKDKATDTQLAEQSAKLTELSAEIGGVAQEYNYESLTESGYVQAGGYVSEGGTTYIHSPYIPILVGSEITCTCNISPSVSCVALYGADKTWKRSIVGTNKLSTQSIVVEEGESYMIMTSLVINKQEYSVLVSKSGIIDDLHQLAKAQTEIGEKISKTLTSTLVVKSHNVYDPSKAESGVYYRYTDGAKVERSDIASTGLIPCKSGDVIYAFRLTTYYGGNVTCWDKEGNFVVGFNATTSPYTIPDNADIAYFRTSFYSWAIESFCININGKYDDDTYQAEEAYNSELPIYAPNINAEKKESITKYYSMTRDSVTSIYGRKNDYGTSFIFSVIAKKNYEDAAILPRLKGTSDTSELGDNNCTTVLAYAKKHQYQHIINAGIFLVADNTADGITIMNGNILKDGVCEQFDVEQYVLGIKANGEMKSYRGMTAQQILDDGCIDAVTGFVPLFENSAAVDNTILSICPHYNIKHPRQIVGILSTGDFFTFCCDGRTDGENGMTLKECINTLSDLASIKYAFNLDGGGSTQSATYHKEINRRLDGRKVPNVIVF